MNWNKLLIFKIIFYILLIFNRTQAKNIQKRGVMDNLNDGLKMAGQMFGINTAADVANLVAKAFSNGNNNRNKPDLISIIQKGLQASPSLSSHSSEEQQNYESADNDQQQAEESTKYNKQFQTKSATSAPAKENVGVNFSTTNLLTSMLRMVGFDASKLGALAINALIMIASAIGNTLMGATKTTPLVNSLDGGRLYNKNPTPDDHNDDNDAGSNNPESGPEEQYSPNDHQPRILNMDSPIDSFLKNPSSKMKRILKVATNKNLADQLTNMIENYETKEGQAACLKMLVCKSSPFIWGMQKSIKNKVGNDEKKSDNENSNTEDITENSEERLFNVQSFFTHLPSINEYRVHGEKCEKLYSIHCNTTDLYNKKKR